MVPPATGVTSRWGEMNLKSGFIDMTKPFTFFRQVRAELAKIVWPTRKETTATAIAVLIMVVLCAIFLFITDQVLSFIIKLILGA